MTTRLDPKVKAKRAEDRKKQKAKEDEVKRNELNALLNVHGNAKKVAVALGVTASSVYEKMKRLGIDTDYGFVKGEPKDPEKRKQWLINLLEKNPITDVAEKLYIHPNSVRARIKKLGIQFEDDNSPNKVIIEALLNEYKTIEKAAKARNQSVEEFKADMKKAGVKNSRK